MVLENEIEIEKATVPGEDGLLPLSVSYDMQWLKRGKANNSLTGHGAIMDSKTNQVINFAEFVTMPSQKVHNLQNMTVVWITKVLQNLWNHK